MNGSKKISCGKLWTVIAPDGKIFEINGGKPFRKFCEQNNLNYLSLQYVARGMALNHKGFKCYANDKKDEIEKLWKELPETKRIRELNRREKVRQYLLNRPKKSKIKKSYNKINLSGKCECCRREFKKVYVHVLQYSSKCYEYYINKYEDKDNFPWKPLSDNNCKDLVFCEVCKRRFKRLGLRQHILQYSKHCYKEYLNRYGTDRCNWPGSLKENKSFCKDCGKELYSYKSKYCKRCRQLNHNVMFDPKVVKKSIMNGEQKRNSKNHRENLSKQTKKQWSTKRKEQQSQYMLGGGAVLAQKYVKNPSGPQIKLYGMIKELYPTAILNYPFIKTKNNKTVQYSLDIAIPEYKLDIEYDGSYWHKDRLVNDELRDQNIKNFGWRVIRFLDYIPTEQELKNKILKEIITKTF